MAPWKSPFSAVIKVTILIIYIHAVQGLPLERLLSESEDFFSSKRTEDEISNFESFIKRTHGLSQPLNVRSKRETGSDVFNEIEDVYELRNLEFQNDFPDFDLLDFQIVIAGHELFALVLQADESQDKADASTTALAVYCRQKANNTWDLVDTQIIGYGYTVQVLDAANMKFVIVAGNDQSLVYEFAPSGIMSFVQQLPILQPSSLSVIDYLGKIYLAVSMPTDVLIYKWRGRHFNVAEKVSVQSSLSVELFSFENTLYLATVKGTNTPNDEYSTCNVWRKRLDGELFDCLQNMGETGAKSIRYFHTFDRTIEEHFLSVIYVDKYPVIYRYDGEKFQPFQRIHKEKALQWMPLKGHRSEFSMFLSTWDGVNVYSYNGWRFQDEKLVLNSGVFGHGAKTMRAVLQGDNSLLFVAHQLNHTTSSAVFKLHYEKTKNTLGAISKISNWCLSRSEMSQPEPFELLSKRLSGADNSPSLHMEGPITVIHGNITELIVEKGFGLLNAEYVEKVNKVAEKTESVGKLLSDVETFMQAIMPGVTTIKGPIHMKYLELVCSEYSPCSFTELNAASLNGEPVDEFLRQTVRISDGIKGEAFLDFHKLHVRNITSDFINSHPAHNLISTGDDSIIRKKIVINGTAIFHSGVFVAEEVGGVILDREHALILNEDQTLTGKLYLSTGSIANLTVKESVNGVNLQKIDEYRKPFQIRDSWDHLSILDLQINDLLQSNYSTDSLKGAVIATKAGASEDEIIADEVIVLDNKISGIDLTEFVRIDGGVFELDRVDFSPSVYVEDLQVSGTLNGQSIAHYIELLNLHSFSARNEQAVTAAVAESCRRRSFLNVVDDMSANIGEADPSEIFEINGPIKVKSLATQHLQVSGTITNVNWTDLISDAVISEEPTLVTGPKTVEGTVYVDDLLVEGYINGLKVEEVLENLTNSAVLFHDGDLVLNNSVTVQHIVAGSLTPDTLSAMARWANNVSFNSGLTASFINSVNLTRLMKDTVSIHEPAKLKRLNFLNELSVDSVNNTGLFNGIQFEKTVLLKNSNVSQEIQGSWLLNGGLNVTGSLIVEGLLNGMDVRRLCNMSVQNPNVFVAGSLKSKVEPKVTKSLNYRNMDGLLSELWFKDQQVVYQGNVEFNRVEALHSFHVNGLVNGVNMSSLPTNYLSKTVTRSMQAPLYIANLTVIGTSRIPHIEGKVNGLNIGEFSKNVLQRGVDQTFTATPTFEELIVPSLNGNFSFNGLNLSTDVLRYDTDKAVVKAKKTMYGLVARSLEVARGVTIQGVDVSSWYENAFLLERDNTVNGNLTFASVLFNRSLSVKGMVGPVQFDRSHILTATGKQIVTGRKHLNGSLSASSLIASALVNGIDLNGFLSNIQHRDRNVTVNFPVVLENIESSSMDVHGHVGSINVSAMCQTVESGELIGELDRKFARVMESAQMILHRITHGAYFLDHYRAIQKLRLNVTALIAAPSSSSNSQLMVVHQTDEKGSIDWMTWDTRDFKFKKGKPSFDVPEDIKFITSGVVANNTYIFLESHNLPAKLLLGDGLFLDSEARNVTCAAPVLIPKLEACFFVGQNTSRDSVLCKGNSTKLEVHQSFNTSKCIQVASIAAGNKTWLAVIAQKPLKSNQEMAVLTMYSYDDSAMVFHPRQVLAVLNPVTVSAMFYRRYYYLAVASPHQPESVRSSVLSLFRYHSKTDKWIRYQEIPLEAPLAVEFVLLPSGQLALYALTANPTRAFVVYLFRGVAGFVEETAGFAMYGGNRLTTFNIDGNHFVGISGQGYGQIIMAEFYGARFG